MSLDDLKGYNAPLLYRKLFSSDDDFYNWLREMGLVASSMACVCGEAMRLENGSRKRFRARIVGSLEDT